jgi:isopentenyl diphosphate isomerase/L-lactate dehydrogenase-like FMN-dependent dehydrogenase
MKSESALARQVRSPRVVNIADLRERARRRLPGLVFDYIDGAAEDETTLERNRAAFRDVTFRPRQCVAVPACDLKTTVLGTEIALPFLLAPVGNIRSFYPQGDAHAARAAHAAGTVFIQSTFSGTRIEDVRAASGGPLWYQLYVPGGRAVAEATIGRAKAAGYSALMVTIDTPVAGLRERDVRRGARQVLSGEFLTSLPYLWQFAVRPRWVIDFIADGSPRVFPNVELPGGPMPAGDVGTLLEQTVVTWHDLRWMRDAWQGPLVVKGVHTPDDARCAMDAGADAIVVSNHGGRQLDGVPGSLRALPEVLAAVDGQIEVLMDGGIRRGADIVKALSMGARAVLIGRAYAWALAAAGGPGVARAIEILKTDLVRTMRLLGCDAVRNLDSRYVDVPETWRVHGPRPKPEA